MLESQHSITASQLENLTIIEGDATDSLAVAKALISPVNKECLVDHIISGIGGAPKMQWSLWAPITLTDPKICESSTRAVISALSTLSSRGIDRTANGKKPFITVISSTGVSRKQRDVALLMIPLYRWGLSVMHADKRVMEGLVMGARKEEFGGAVVVRPSHLEDLEVRGAEGVRVGWEWFEGSMEMEGKQEKGPAIGYWVGRKDVGEWIFREVVEKGGEEWDGKGVSLVY